MKIAHINMLHNGSPGKIMLSIAETAERKGHFSRTYSPVLYARKRKIDVPHIKNHFTWGSRWENCIHYYIGTLFGINGMLSKRGTKKLLNYLEDFQPDIIHLHNLHNYTINLQMLFDYIKKRDIKTVWTLHDCWAFTGHCPYFDMVKCEEWKTECHNCPQKYIYPKTYLDMTRWMYRWKKRIFRGVNGMVLVTPSEWLMNLVKQSYLKDYPVKVINNGIDLSIFRPQESSVNESINCNGKYLVLGVAFDWGKRKGLDVFIELSRKLGDSYQVMLVGTTESIDELLPENVLSIHRTENQDELAKIYSSADVFVNPTREENYPTVNMEALACGTPVVTFHTGGSPEMLDESCGIVVERDDVSGMISAIRGICEEKNRRKVACIEKAKSFDMNRKFSEYVDLYEDIRKERS